MILGCIEASTIFGVRMQAEQSNVGKVLSSWAILPTISTLYPASAISRAVWIPAIPPPITKALFSTWLSPDTSGVFKSAFATAAFTREIAFSVPSSLFLWTHEQCSLILAISTR